MKNIYYNAGLRIRKLREKRHYTRDELAELAEISSKFLYEIETGTKGFSADTLCKLAEALETNTDYILFGEYREESDNEILHIIAQFEESQTRNLVKIMELIYQLSK